MEYAIRIRFKGTNNEPEYETLLARLRVIIKIGVDSLDAFSDSQLVVNQVQGDYLAKDTRMVAYLDEVKTISRKIKDFRIRQILENGTRRLMLWITLPQPLISSHIEVYLWNSL